MSRWTWTSRSETCVSRYSEYCARTNLDRDGQSCCSTGLLLQWPNRVTGSPLPPSDPSPFSCGAFNSLSSASTRSPRVWYALSADSSWLFCSSWRPISFICSSIEFWCASTSASVPSWRARSDSNTLTFSSPASARDVALPRSLSSFRQRWESPSSSARSVAHSPFALSSSSVTSFLAASRSIVACSCRVSIFSVVVLSSFFKDSRSPMTAFISRFSWTISV